MGPPVRLTGLSPLLCRLGPIFTLSKAPTNFSRLLARCLAGVTTAGGGAGVAAAVAAVVTGAVGAAGVNGETEVTGVAGVDGAAGAAATGRVGAGIVGTLLTPFDAPYTLITDEMGVEVDEPSNGW